MIDHTHDLPDDSSPSTTDLLQETWLAHIGHDSAPHQNPADTVPDPQPATARATEAAGTDPPRGQYVRLRDILADIPTTERGAIVTGFEAGIRCGRIRAVELTDVRISTRWLDPDGTSRRRTLHDEQILDTPELRAWLRERCTEARYAHRAMTGKLGSTHTALSSGADDFAVLASLRHEALNSRTKRRK